MKKLYQSCFYRKAFFFLQRLNPFKSESLQKKLQHSSRARSFSGFSILELTTVVGIIAVLMAVALPIYSKYKRRAIQGRMQHELSGVRKSLSYVHSVDGGYHQKLYTAGYNPDQELIAEVGFSYADTVDICCNLFPNSANIASQAANFFTIKSNAYSGGSPEASVRASHICDRAGKCTVNADCVPSGVKNKKLNPMSLTGGCSTAFSSKTFKCDCDNYRIYAITKWKSSDIYLFANQDGKFCASTDGSTVNNF